MYYLLVGFITPAVVFAILGFIACWRRNTNVDFKEYESIGSSDMERGNYKSPCYHMNRTPPPSFSMTFQNRYRVSYELPPSYSEATNLHSSELPSRHLPRDAGRKCPSKKLRPPVQV